MSAPDGPGLVARLRATFTVRDEFSTCTPLVNPDGPEAADRIEQLEAELARRDRNEIRNCLNWGPCSEHDGYMGDHP